MKVLIYDVNVCLALHFSVEIVSRFDFWWEPRSQKELMLLIFLNGSGSTERDREKVGEERLGF